MSYSYTYRLTTSTGHQVFDSFAAVVAAAHSTDYAYTVYKRTPAGGWVVVGGR